MNSQEEIRKVKEAVTKIGEQIQEKRKLLKQESNKINTKVFENVVLAIFIMLYVIFLNLGFVNIERNIYLTDLRVFSASFLIVAIILFEKAYTKENSTWGIHGIESLVLGFITMFFVYYAMKYPSSYIFISLYYAYLFAAYYLIKSTVIAVKMKKEYRDKLSDIKEIVKKIKPVKKEAYKRKKEENKEKIDKQEQIKSKAQTKAKASKSEVKPVKQETNTSRKTTNQTKTKKAGENKVVKTTTKATAKSSSKATAQSTKKINKKTEEPVKKTASKSAEKSKTTTKANTTKSTSTKKKSSSSTKKVAPKKEEKKEQVKAKTGKTNKEK